MEAWRVGLVGLVMLGACAVGVWAAPFRIGIWRQPDLPERGAPGDPDYLAELLQAAGYQPVALSAEDLASAEILDPGSMPVVVLPYGPLFPAEAAENWKRYLHRGGSFFSTGGYAFDEPVWRRDGRWLTWDRIIAADPEWLVNGAFEGPRGWVVEGDREAAHFGPHPQREGRPGLVLGYPYEATYRDGGRETTVVVRQSIELPPGDYLIRFRSYARWLHGGGSCWVRLTLFDRDDQEIAHHDLLALGIGEGAPWSLTERPFQVAPPAARAEVRIVLDRLAGVLGLADLHLERASPLGEPINSRTGRASDGMMLPEDSITAFDLSFPLRYAARAAADPGQQVAPASLELEGPFEGMVADAMVADGARLLPLLKALDRYGRPRGALGAIVYHWDHHYRDSAWALWGVTNRDLFARGHPAMARLFQDTIERLVSRLYLVHPRAGLPCYRDHEGSIPLAVSVLNNGAADHEVTVRLRVTNEQDQEVYSDAHDMIVPARGRTEPAWSFDPRDPLPGGFYRITALLETAGRPYDRLEGGFFVWDEERVTSGPRYLLRDNVIEVNGRPTFLPGADMHGAHVDRWMDGPLLWLNDARAMRDFGLLNYEPIEAWTPWHYPEGEARDQARARLFSKVAGEIMASRSAGLQFLLTQGLAGDMALEADRMAEAEAATEDYLRRFNYPHALQYWIGGDLACILNSDKPWLLERWQAFLRQRYGTPEPPGSEWAPDLSAPWSAFLTGGRWSDPRRLDWSDFVLQLEREYVERIGGAVRRVVPEAVVTAEYPSWPGPHRYYAPQPDPWNGQRWLDISNTGAGGYPLSVAESVVYSDLGLIGKPLTLGEWGNVIHPGMAGRSRDLDEPQGDTSWLNQNAIMFGIGAVQVRQWDWRDLSPWHHWLFNWGAVHSQDWVPKEAGRLVRCLNLLLRMPELRYRPKPVALVIPVSHKRGSSAVRMAQVCRHAIKLLSAARADVAPIAEDLLDRLPEGVRVLVWPMPYCPGDETVARVEAFVRAGGALYLSGDLRYDQDRQPTRADRLERLCGVRAVSPPQPDSEFPQPPEVESVGALWQAPFWVHRLGGGMVYYLPQNLEDAPIDQWLIVESWRNPPRIDRVIPDCAAVYRDFLERAGLDPLVHGGSADIRCWRRPTADGGAVYTLFHGAISGEPADLRLPTPAGEFRLNVPAARPAMAWVDGRRRVRALLAQGEVRLNGERLLAADTLAIVASLFPADIRDGQPLAVMPLWAGAVELPANAGDTAVLGDLHDGRWRALETREARGGVLRADPLQAREITIVATASDQARAGAQVEAWIMRPWEAARASW